MSTPSPIIWRGVTWQRRVTVTNKSSGAPVDLTGSTLTFSVRAFPGGPDAITCSIGDGLTLLAQSGATLGQVDVEISTGKSSPVADGVYSYSLLGVIGGVDYLVIEPTKVSVRSV